MSLPTSYQDFIALSRYARWLPDKKRRELWHETIERLRAFWLNKFPFLTGEPDFHDAIKGIEELMSMGSMRTLMTAGPALERDHVAGYNCAYTVVDHPKVFDETMYILMCGTGVGFSCESKYTDQLPVIAESFSESDTTIVVRDSKIGWASAYRELVTLLYNGQVPKWDVSKIRPAGAPLKTFGGRASGPEPLVSLFKYTVNTFRRFAGHRLPTIAVNDLMCKIAEIVVVGGVRRSALISLSDLHDPYMRNAKGKVNVIEYTLLGYDDKGDKRKYSMVVDDAPYGERSLILFLDDWESEQLQRDHLIDWYHVHAERALANNSIAYTATPNVVEFMDEWKALIQSGSGERGIFFRGAAKGMIPERRVPSEDYGCNPCSEIILRPKQFCNLSEIVAREHDNVADLKLKVKHAVILGTLQATLTDFRYLSHQWKKNTEEERLLGVSFTGIMDHQILSGRFPGGNGIPGAAETLPQLLEELRDYAVEVNQEWAGKLGIAPSAAITCVKPSGTVSQLVDSASGIHPRYSRYYLRTVRSDKKDPLAQMMKDAGFYCEDDVTKPDSTLVFYFPVKAPDHAVLRDEVSAIDQLELWKIYQMHWCEHKPSITVYVRKDEWLKVGAWVYENFDIMSGVSFLPYSEHTYKQAPYQEITESEYEEWVAKMPEGIDWDLSEYETNDAAVAGVREYACTGDKCEIL